MRGQRASWLRGTFFVLRWVILCLALGIAGCRSGSETPEKEHPNAIRRGRHLIAVNGNLSESEWHRWYAARRPAAQLHDFAGVVRAEDPSLSAPLTLRISLRGVKPGHVRPESISKRVRPGESFRFRALPPCEAILLRVLRGDVQLAAEELLFAPGTVDAVVPIYPLAVLDAEVERADGEPIGRWIASMHRAAPSLTYPQMPSEPSLPKDEPLFETAERRVPVHFDRLTSGTWTFALAIPGFGREERTVTVAPGQRIQLGTVTAGPGPSLAVAVDDGGTGLALHASVTIAFQTGVFPAVPIDPRSRRVSPGAAEDRRQAPLGSAGFARFDGLYPGTYRVAILSEGSPQGTTSVEIDDETDTSVTLRLHPTAPAVLVVRDRDGRPIPNAVLSIATRGGEQPTQWALTAGADGTARFSFPPGRFRVLARAPRNDVWPRAEQTIVVQPETRFDTPIDLRVPASGTFSGSLLRDGRAEPDGSLSLRWRQWSPALPRIAVNTDGTGAFSVAVPPGDYDLYNGLDFLRRVRVEEGTAEIRETIDLRRADVAVFVTDPENGKPIGGAAVVLDPVDSALSVRERFPLRVAEPLEDGSLLLRNVPLGRYDLCAIAPGRRPLRAPLLVLEPGRLEERMELLPGGSTLRLTVTHGRLRRPLRNAQVQRPRLDGLPLYGANPYTDEHGVLELRDLPPGELSFDIVPPPSTAGIVPIRLSVSIPAEASALDRAAYLPSGSPANIFLESERSTPFGAARLRWDAPPPAGDPLEPVWRYVNELELHSGLFGNFPTVLLPRGVPVRVRIELPGRPAVLRELRGEGARPQDISIAVD